MNLLKSYYHVTKHSAIHLLGVNPRLTSVRCMLRRAQSPLISIKNRIALAFALISKLGFTFSFTVNFMMRHERSFAIESVML